MRQNDNHPSQLSYMHPIREADLRAASMISINPYKFLCLNGMNNICAEKQGAKKHMQIKRGLTLHPFF